VTVSGGGFGPGSVVRFGSVAAHTVSTSAGAIVAAAPPGVGTVPVTVSTAAGTSAAGPSAAYTYTFANAPYSIDLSASPTSPAPGSSTTLVASASVDVGPTPYGISIFDTTAGAELVHAGTGSSLAASVSRAAAATHSYVAKICNPGGVNAQASSVTVSVTWS